MLLKKMLVAVWVECSINLFITEESKEAFIQDIQVQHEAYWNISHATKLQLEDVVDTLMTIFYQFDLVFLFYQLSDHAKMQIDSLHIRNMNVLHKESVGIMHDTIIQEVGHLPNIPQVGNKQVIYFIKCTNGPF